MYSLPDKSWLLTPHQKSPRGAKTTTATALQCFECKQKFSNVIRKHCCRSCRSFFCGVCSDVKVILLENGDKDKQRLCFNCVAFQQSGSPIPFNRVVSLKVSNHDKDKENLASTSPNTTLAQNSFGSQPINLGDCISSVRTPIEKADISCRMFETPRLSPSLAYESIFENVEKGLVDDVSLHESPRIMEQYRNSSAHDSNINTRNAEKQSSPALAYDAIYIATGSYASSMQQPSVDFEVNPTPRKKVLHEVCVPEYKKKGGEYENTVTFDINEILATFEFESILSQIEQDLASAQPDVSSELSDVISILDQASESRKSSPTSMSVIKDSEDLKSTGYPRDCDCDDGIVNESLLIPFQSLSIDRAMMTPLQQTPSPISATFSDLLQLNSRFDNTPIVDTSTHSIEKADASCCPSPCALIISMKTAAGGAELSFMGHNHQQFLGSEISTMQGAYSPGRMDSCSSSATSAPSLSAPDDSSLTQYSSLPAATSVFPVTPPSSPVVGSARPSVQSPDSSMFPSALSSSSSSSPLRQSSILLSIPSLSSPPSEDSLPIPVPGSVVPYLPDSASALPSINPPTPSQHSQSSRDPKLDLVASLPSSAPVATSASLSFTLLLPATLVPISPPVAHSCNPFLDTSPQSKMFRGTFPPLNGIENNETREQLHQVNEDGLRVYSTNTEIRLCNNQAVFMRSIALFWKRFVAGLFVAVVVGTLAGMIASQLVYREPVAGRFAPGVISTDLMREEGRPTNMDGLVAINNQLQQPDQFEAPSSPLYGIDEKFGSSVCIASPCSAEYWKEMLNIDAVARMASGHCCEGFYYGVTTGPPYIPLFKNTSRVYFSVEFSSPAGAIGPQLLLVSPPLIAEVSRDFIAQTSPPEYDAQARVEEVSPQGGHGGVSKSLFRSLGRLSPLRIARSVKKGLQAVAKKAQRFAKSVGAKLRSMAWWNRRASRV